MSRDSCSPSPERKIVVIIASSDDLHAISVAHFIDSTTDCTAIIVDFAEFPQKLQAFIRFDSGIGESGLIIKGELIPLNRIRSIWLRRLNSHKPSQELKHVADDYISRKDSQTLVEGLLLTVQVHGVSVVNDYYAELRARNKIAQLHAAVEVGLTIPRTLITNSPELARRFVDERMELGEQVIVKGFCPPAEAIVFTRFVNPAEEDYELLKFAPAIFQTYVPGNSLRVTVVGDEVFSARVLTTEEDAQVDWRRQYFNPLEKQDHTFQKHEIIEFCKSLNILYGALDFQMNGQDLFFLECNSGGQFLFVEIQTEQPICKAFARLLTNTTKIRS